jgi:hypothetical protein
MRAHQKECSGHGKVVSLTNVGLVVSTEHPYLGASLDGFVQCPKCGEGALEIKCTFKHRYFCQGSRVGVRGVGLFWMESESVKNTDSRLLVKKI